MYALAQALGQCNGPAVPGTCSLYRRPLRIIEPGPFVSSYYFTIVQLTRFGKEVKYFVQVLAMWEVWVKFRGSILFCKCSVLQRV